MYRFLIPFNRNPYLYLKYFTYFNRYYRTKIRKKVSIELNKPSLYDNKRNSPSKLLKENLFTPESAGYRELPMLCFWIVNYGFADSSILTRYVQCAIDNIKKLKIKSIALIFHSVSKYLYNSSVSLVESHQIEGSEVEFKNRDVLIKRCIHLIFQSSPLLPNLFVNAVPKDLGMISISVMNIYEMFLNECNIQSLSSQNEQTNIEGNNQNQKPNINNQLEFNNVKSIGFVVNKLLQKLSKEIIPKLPFCEIDEFSAFAKSFCKVNTDWSSLFMRELSLEFSSLLLDKIEDLEMLKQNKFIGEDLIGELNKLPKELCTITCSLSKCKLNEPRFWERTQKALDLLLELKNKNFGIKEIDVTTLTLLCTSMANYSDVTKLVEEISIISTESDQQSILIGFNVSSKNLKNKELAKKFLSKINMDRINELNPKLISQFILNFSRSGLIDNNDYLDFDDTNSSLTTNSNIINSTEVNSSSVNVKTSSVVSNIRQGIVSMLDNELNAEIMSAIFVSSVSLGVSMETRFDLCNRLSGNLEYLETQHLVNMFLNSVNMLTHDNIKVFCKEMLDIIYNRVDEIQLNTVIPILFIVSEYFGGNLQLIKRLCSRIDQNFNDFDISEVSKVFDKLTVMGLNVNKLFNRNINKIREFNKLDYMNKSYKINDTDLIDESSNILLNNDLYEFGFVGNEEMENDEEYNKENRVKRIHELNNINKIEDNKLKSIDKTDKMNSLNKVKFTERNQDEVSEIARYTNIKTKTTKIFNSDDFIDMINNNSNENKTMKFELTKYPTNLDNDEIYDYNEKNKYSTKNNNKRSTKSSSPSGSTLDDLKNAWSELRHNF